MVRIKGIDLPDNKNAVIALTYIYGVGLSTSKKVLKKVKVDQDKKVKDLTDKEVKDIRTELDGLVLEGDLSRKIKESIKNKIEIGSYQGIRHRKKMPVRGQKTRNNARTVRGKKNSVVPNKKKV